MPKKQPKPVVTVWPKKTGLDGRVKRLPDLDAYDKTRRD